MPDKDNELGQCPDWERIEIEYRAGVMSLREIAEAHGNGTNHVAISRRAKKEGWERDLSARIKARAETLVTKQAVTADVTANRTVTENQVVEANATMQANIIRAHRKDIIRGRALSMALLAKLEATTGDEELFQRLGEIMASPDERGKDRLNDIYKAVISLPGTIDSMKKWGDTLKTLVGMEREAFGINGGGEEAGGVIVGTKTDYVAIRALIASRKNAAQP